MTYKKSTLEHFVTEENKKYMQRAINLAQKGAGWVSPNPMVGAVIVKSGKTIDEGWHKKFGENHAEINAIINAGESNVKGSTLYVTLEPCCIYGKTPPCTDAIIKFGIERVVIGTLDPNPKINGKGVEILKRNNIKVNVGILEDEARRVNEFFIKFHKKRLPFIISKWAMGLDGSIATSKGESKWISSKKSREYVHLIRSRVDAIIVGINTIIKDDPLLNVRLKKKKVRQPKRIILDSKLRIFLNARCLDLKNGGEVIIATTVKNKISKIKKLEEKGATVIFVKSKGGKVDLRELLKILIHKNIISCLVEGGAQVHSTFFKERLVDKVIVFIAPKILGGSKEFAPLKEFSIKKNADSIKLINLQIKRFEDDICYEGYVVRNS